MFCTCFCAKIDQIIKIAKFLVLKRFLRIKKSVAPDMPFPPLGVPADRLTD